MTIENTVSSDFDPPGSSIVKSVFDCRLPGVELPLALFMFLCCSETVLKATWSHPVSKVLH